MERAFRTLKTSRLEVRPIFVYSEERVRAHVFLCMLAYYVEWHMRGKLAPLLFQDDDPGGALAKRASPVARAEASDRARAKAGSKMTADGFPARSFTTLLSDLATLTLNEAAAPANPEHRFPVFAQPTPLQSRAFELLEVDPAKIVTGRIPSEIR